MRQEVAVKRHDVTCMVTGENITSVEMASDRLVGETGMRWHSFLELSKNNKGSAENGIVVL